MIDAQQVALLLQGSTFFPNVDGVNEIISWKLTRYSIGLMPFSFFQCEMTFGNISSSGYGCAWTQTGAAVKAFGEAWERICFFRKSRVGLRISDEQSSNGFAAGRNLESAISASRSELIERAIVLQAWSQKSGWVRSKSKSLKAMLLQVVLYFRRWKVDFYDVRSNLGDARACLIRHKTKGAIFDSAFGAAQDEMDEKLILSVVKSSFLPEPDLLEELPLSGGPSLHWRFYRNPKNLTAFDFLENCDELRVELGPADEIVTTVVENAGEMPAVCVSENRNWTALTWGCQTIRGKNSWPHPIA